MGFWIVLAGCIATVEPTPATPPVATEAPAPAPERAPPAPRLPDGCVATVDELPSSDRFERDDPRLQGSALVVVAKEARRSMLFSDGRLATTDEGPACWPVALARGYAPGHKQRMGDLRTPEGWWRTSDRPWSAFSHAITVHYPGPADAKRGFEAGWFDATTRDAIVDAHRSGTLPPMETRLGGKILLHGGGAGADWTLGCVAYDDAHIRALRAHLPEGMRTNVLILP